MKYFTASISVGIILHCPKPKWNTYVEYLSFDLVVFRLFHFVCWSYNLRLAFFSALSLVAFTVGLFISFCYCTIILIKWIFKQINADSIRISLFFAAAAALVGGFVAVVVVAVFVEHSEVAIVVMRHARMRNMLKGSCIGKKGRKRDGGYVDFKYQRQRQRHMCGTTTATTTM